jgi:hypothetical protein
MQGNPQTAVTLRTLAKIVLMESTRQLARRGMLIPLAKTVQMASTLVLMGRLHASNVMPEGTATTLSTLIRRHTAKTALLG